MLRSFSLHSVKTAASSLLAGVASASGFESGNLPDLLNKLPVKTIAAGCVALSLSWLAWKTSDTVLGWASQNLSRRRTAHNYCADNSIPALDQLAPLEDDDTQGDEPRGDEGVNSAPDPHRPSMALTSRSARGNMFSSPASRLAKRCGIEVRTRLGYPTRSRANKVLVVQRCASWLQENASSLRRCYYEGCLAQAVLVALTPSKAELRLSRLLNDPEVADREHYCNHAHTIPLFRGVVGEWLSMLSSRFCVSSTPGF